MRNKITWLIVGVFIVAVVGGFFMGRFFTIRRNASFIAKEMPEGISVEEIKRYRHEMKRLRDLMKDERESIILAVKGDEMEEVRRHIDSISRIKREILIQTINQMNEISKTLPPSIRKSFIEQKLKEPYGKYPAIKKFRVIKRRY